ncbi:MAG: quinone oxidoreductase [Pseudomonadota bacterium]
MTSPETDQTKAIRIHAFGDTSVLQWESVALPSPAPGEVRLHHTAIGVNFIDTYHRSGLYPLTLPTGLGSEASAVIEQLGSGVTGFHVGQRVVYAGRGPVDGYSERRNVPADWLIALPDDIDDEVGAASLLKGLTAWFLIHRSYRVCAGDWVLVHAAAGGVGQFLTQWAAHLGAKVIGVVSSAEKAALALRNGCQHVLTSGPAELAGEVRALTDAAGVAVVYDSVGAATFEASLDSLARHGVMVSYGNASGPPPPIAPLDLARRGSLYLTRPVLFDFIADASEREAAADALFGLIRDGVLKVAVNQRFALADAASAHRALEARATTGATVLLPD